MLRAVIFDFDFTLADSSAGVLECMRHALDRLGLPPAPDQRILETIGLTLPAALASLMENTDAEIAQEFMRCFIAKADEIMADLTVLYACVPGVIHSLRSAGLAQAIVSTKLRYRIEGILAREQLSDHFAVIVGAEDTSHHKPDPAGLLLAARRLGCLPEEAVYVGDHVVDAEAAARAGMPFVATRTGVTERERFAESQVLGIIDDLSALPDLLGVRWVECLS